MLFRSHIASIARKQIELLERRLGKMEISLDVSEAAIKRIADAGFDPIYGARPLKRAIQSELENPLAKRILEGGFAAKDTVRVDVEKGALRFTRA